MQKYREVQRSRHFDMNMSEDTEEAAEEAVEKGLERKEENQANTVFWKPTKDSFREDGVINCVKFCL